MILTITCKDIISEDLEAFKSQINRFNLLEVSDQMFLFTQQILLTKYGNSQVRYETEDNFLNALSLRFADIAPVYEKKFNIIAEAIEIDNEEFIAEIKNFTEDKQNTIISSQNDYRKEAETPTTVKATTDFIDHYINNASKDTTDGRSEERGKLSHKESNTNEIIDKIDKLNKFRSMLYEKYSNEYNDLFIQFL